MSAGMPTGDPPRCTCGKWWGCCCGAPTLPYMPKGDLSRNYVPIAELDSAIQCLREIAAMGKKAGSETAQHWLLQHGYPLEDGGYVPGRGFLGEP